MQLARNSTLKDADTILIARGVSEPAKDQVIATWTELNASLLHCLFPSPSQVGPSTQKSLAAAAAKCCVSAVLEEARLINLARDNQQTQWSKDRYNKAESNAVMC